jgi:hypothetical protein
MFEDIITQYVYDLLQQGIEPLVIDEVIINYLKDIVVNVQTLRDGGIKIGLVNEWLKNGTHLNDAIAIMNQGVNLNLIGTSRKVGDFTGLTGATPNEVVSRVPAYAKILPWGSDSSRIKKGMNFGWTDLVGQDWVVRMHEPDTKARMGSNAASGWIVRILREDYYMDDSGNFFKKDWLKRTSSRYNEANANGTHIPIQAP